MCLGRKLEGENCGHVISKGLARSMKYLLHGGHANPIMSKSYQDEPR